MQRFFLFFFSFFFLLLNSAFADVTVSISDIKKKKMKVTYTHIDNNAGNKVLGFSEQAFDFAKGPIDVISAREINTDQGLKYNKFSSPNSMDIGSYRESIIVDYPFPIPKGEEFKIEVTVEATTDNIYFESEGKYIVTYETGDQLFFILPEKYSIVFSNVPVLIDEKNNSVIVQVKKISETSERRKLIFKIQAVSKEVSEELDGMVLTEKPILESKIPVALLRYMSISNTDIKKSISRKKPLSYPYSLKLGAFRTLERTQKAITYYINKGFCPYWIKVDLKENGKWYRIFTGHFENYEKAKRYKQEHGLNESIVSETPYSCFIGNYKSLEELESKTLSLEHNGYSPYIIEDPKGVFRLFIGVFFTIDEAAKQCDEMKSHSIQCHIVKR